MKEYAFNLHALWTVAVTNWVCPELFVLVVSNFFVQKTRAELKPKLKKINCCYLRWDIVAVQK